MKLTSKHQYFRPKPNSGLYENAFLRTGRTIIEKDFIHIIWFFGYMENSEEVKVMELPPISFGEKQTTLILDENDIEVDIVEFLMDGGTYDKSRVVHWGRPSKNDMINIYLNPESLQRDLELTDTEPQRQIAKDWVLENVFAFGNSVGEDFEFETI